MNYLKYIDDTCHNSDVKKKKKVTFSARNLILLLSPLKRNNHPSLINDYYSVSSSFSQCFSGIISGAWGFRLSKLHLFPSSFWWPPHQGPSKFLESRGREALAIMWSGLALPQLALHPAEVSLVLLVSNRHPVLKGRTFLQTYHRLQPPCPDSRPLAVLLAFGYPPQVPWETSAPQMTHIYHGN